jgi:hypothetical protein
MVIAMSTGIVGITETVSAMVLWPATGKVLTVLAVGDAGTTIGTGTMTGDAATAMTTGGAGITGAIAASKTGN